MTNQESDNSEPSMPSTRERDLVVFEITEMAKGKVIKWLRAAVAVLVIIVSLFGLKAYADYRSALATIDTKIAERVREEVAEYRKFTDQIISEVVTAKTRANDFRGDMDELDGRVAKLKDFQASYERELSSLRDQARERFNEYNLTLVELRVSPRESAARANEHANFIARSKAFAKKIGLEVAAPTILFEPNENEAIQALYDADRRAYVVNTSWLGKAEYLPEYVAIMGRFMLLHYDRAIGDGSGDGLADPTFWNSFRMSLQNYLIEANTDSDSGASYIPDDDLLRFLKDLEDRTDVATVTKLAVTLLVSFDPTWTRNTLPKVLSDINQKERLVAEEHMAESVKSIWGK